MKTNEWLKRNEHLFLFCGVLLNVVAGTVVQSERQKKDVDLLWATLDLGLILQIQGGVCGFVFELVEFISN